MKTHATIATLNKWRGLCNWAGTAFLTLLTAASVRAGTITIVDLPATGTDAGSGIATTNTYVCAFDFGTSSSAITINSVPFTHFQLIANNTIQVTNLTDVNFGGRVVLSAGGINNSKLAATSNTAGLSGQCNGSTLTLLTDCVYPGSVSQAGDWIKQECDNLRPGDNYSFRIYYRDWNNSSGDRQSSFTFNSDGTNVATNVQEDAGGAHYVEYDFTAYQTNVFCTISNMAVGGPQPWLLFGSTLQNTFHSPIPFIPYNPAIAGLGNMVYQFSVHAYGDPPLSYQWYYNTVSNYSGAIMATDGNGYFGSTSNILTATNNLLDYYFLVVANGSGYATSSIVQINPTPVILTQPTVINAGFAYVGYTNLTVSGFQPLSYQWYFNTASNYNGAIITTDGNGYSGSTNANLQATTNLQDYYFAIVTNSYGSATSSIIAYNPYPFMVTQPVSSIVGTIVGGSVGFTASGNGWPALGYRWYFNTVSNYTGASVLSDGGGISGSTTTNVTLSNAAQSYYVDYYFVVVSNYYGSVTSSIAQAISPLTVVAAGEPIWNQTSQTNVIITFSDNLDPITAATIGNYSLTPGVTIFSATVVASNEVALTTSPLSGSYTLTVANVNDYFGLAMLPSPTNVTVGAYPANIALWVRADTGVTADGSGNVSLWNDLSGNNNALNTISAVSPLLYTNIYGDAVIHFTGTNKTEMDAFDSPSLAITGDISIIAVMNFAALGAANGEIVSKTGSGSGHNNIPAPIDYSVGSTAGLGRGDGTSYGFGVATNAPWVGQPQILAVSESGNTVSHFIDGQPAGTSGLSRGFQEAGCGNAGQDLTIGVRADGVDRLTGDISEMIIAGSAISSYDVTQLDNYLIAKHNISFVNLSPTKILVSAGSGKLTLSWPLDHTGWTLQSQTNNLSVGIGTNWVNVSGSSGTNQMVIPINPANGAVFYRLRH